MLNAYPPRPVGQARPNPGSSPEARVRWFATQVKAGTQGRFDTGQSDPEAVRLLGRSGLLGLTMPPRYGGLGQDFLALGRVCETLGRLDLSYQISVTVHLALTAMTILQWGSEAQRDRWLPLLAAGDEIATFGLTEPGAGSDVAALRARAVPSGGGFLLSGEKTWISGATESTLFLIFATVDPALRHKGITAFIVPRLLPGLGTPPLPGKLGIRAGDTGSVVLNDVWVPAEHVLGEVGEGFPVALSALATGLFTVGYGALGITAESLRLAREIVRADAATPAGTGNQLVRQQIAAMVAREAAARVLLDRAATLKNRGLPSQQQTSLAKWTAAQAAVDTTSSALDLAQRFNNSHMPTLERHLRNAKGAVIYGGTNEVHQQMQGAYALGDRAERPPRRPPLTARDLAGEPGLACERVP